MSEQCTPSTADMRNAVTRDESDWREAGAQFDRWLDARDDRLITAAEQLGAEWALRNAARFFSSPVDDRFASWAAVAEYLNDSADRLEGGDEWRQSERR